MGGIWSFKSETEFDHAREKVFVFSIYYYLSSFCFSDTTHWHTIHTGNMLESKTCIIYQRQ